jgi:hypothetical protein
MTGIDTDRSPSRSARSVSSPFDLATTITAGKRPIAPFAASTDGSLNSLQAYLLDAWQRSVLFLDTLRQRGNEQEKIVAEPAATVLRFEHEVLMSGRALPRPINYSLSRVVPPNGIVLDPHKRPVVVVDPRAGQGPGIGGFKAESEIGDALNAGHPVYFINFAAEPAPGQQFLDIVEGQVKFFERVVELHPDAPRPFAIGNCQAGYQTLMVAMLRPDLFGPCLVAGSPMSYWQGVHGKNPMRYSGGLLGGSWLTALTSDLGNGKFDGTWLISNFDNLNPANFLWGKQYDLYAGIDTEAKRYLEFEKWWGDFIELNGDEIQFLVDQFFIGDKLARNQIVSTDGKAFDLRNITSPLIVFTSLGDNISPPPQTLGWILDLYRDVDDIRATGRTIVYCLNQTVGHLAIFVSSKVGAKEDEEFIQLMDVIDTLPPGLYELVISPRPAEVAPGGFVSGDWVGRFEARSLDDIRALGRNTIEDDRAFATAARVSEINHSAYRTFLQPFVRAVASQPMADLMRKMNPLRLGYTLFAGSNPLMHGVGKLAADVAADRHPVEPDNLFWQMQGLVSKQINTALDSYRDVRDRLVEQTFFAIYGSPVVQGLLGVRADDAPVRQLPAISPEQVATRKANAEAYAAKLTAGGFDEALVRAMIYVVSADRALDQRCALAMNVARQQLMHLSLDAFKALMRDQFFVLVLERKRAIDVLGTLVPTTEKREELQAQLNAILAAAGAPTSAERERLARLAQVLGKGRGTPARAGARPRTGQREESRKEPAATRAEAAKARADMLTH